MNWRDFQRLSRDYQTMQLSLLRDACPEEMALGGLLAWGRLLSNCLLYSSKIEADKTVPEEHRAHWGEIRSHSLAQMRRIGSTLSDWVATALDEGSMSAKDRCAVFDLAGLCSRGFQDEADGLRRAADAAGKDSQVPDFVSVQALNRLAGLPAVARKSADD
jgi:hypothetical protein